MKTLKHIFVVLLIILSSGLITFYIKPNNPILVVFLLITISFFIFNLIVRKSLSYKKYFISPYNIFTTKSHYEKSYNISKDLMFKKVIEVINNSNFKLAETDKRNFEILATSKLTFKSWGENLYIDFETKGDETVMKFYSSTLFQMYSWGKNEKNYNDLLNNIEDSLII